MGIKKTLIGVGGWGFFVCFLVIIIIVNDSRMIHSP